MSDGNKDLKGDNLDPKEDSNNSNRGHERSIPQELDAINNSSSAEVESHLHEGSSAYYDYETEKQYSQVDAKLFYQGRQMRLDSTSSMIRPGQDASSPPASAQGDSASILAEGSQWRSENNAKAPDAQMRSPEQRLEPNAHSTKAGIDSGFDSDPGSLTKQDPEVSLELMTICGNIQKILDLRHKYIRLSLQRPGDNPKDSSRWHIYPEPPKPVWHDKTTSDADDPYDAEKPEASRTHPDSAPRPTQARKDPRKPGTDIGEDFRLSDLFPIPGESEMVYELDSTGVYQVYENSKAATHHTPIIAVPTLREYYMDLDIILSFSSDGPAKSFAFRRLQYLEGKFNLYFLLHEYQEITDSKRVPHRDFYNVRKVDTHVHHSSCMNQKHLLRFIKSKMKKRPDEIVLFRDGKELSLRQVFESINLTAYDLSIDTLDMHAQTDSFHRFDKFNLKYNPIGESRLRTIFLKTDNYISGRYLAELTKEVIVDLESSKYQMVEWRISIYGRSLDEWDKLAGWIVDNKLFSHNVRWLIQIPRLYDIYKSAGNMENFEQLVENIFKPLFEVTKNPGSNPKLHIFLQRVVGFDSVDDESKPERRLYRKFPFPSAWNTAQSPPYSYWMYYLFANITSLNAWRKQRGFNTFLLRPHCGEAGETDHLAAAVLCTHSINHGILLRKVPVLQYIFYLEQIGIAMSPLSNNALFLAYERNPFLSYFKRGLNVSLSTDDPLQIAFTKEPLIEEYSVAAQIYKLNAVDMCELAKNSVLQSGFEHALKKQWLGNKYYIPGSTGNNMAKTNVPDIREGFRHDTLGEELSLINRYAMAANPGKPLSSESLPPPNEARISSQAPQSPSISMLTNISAMPPSIQDTQNPRNTIFSSIGQPLADQIPHNINIRESLITSDSHHLQPQRLGVPMVTKTSSSLTSGESWLGSITEPKSFPGVLHGRVRRGTLRSEITAENDDE